MPSVKPGARTDPAALLRLEGITKRFGAATALDGVDFAVRSAEVHALVGENGAGKSTLVKIITGAYHRDGGTMYLDDRAVNFHTPAEAQASGVCAVHQEIHLLGMRTVAENIFVGREPLRWGLVDWKRMTTDAEALLASLGLEIDPRATLGALDTARQQMVAIARGVSLGARVLVLDEPTSSLPLHEVAILHGLMRRLQARGTGIVYISHRFDELYAVCDRVTVLRDGKVVTTQPLAQLDRLDLVCAMLGKSREALREGSTAFRHAPATRAAPDPSPLLTARALSGGAMLRDMSVEIARGEIVGLAGLLGSGRTEAARAIFGDVPAESGAMTLDGVPYAPHQPDEAIRVGVGFVSEDRKGEGIIPDMSVRENLTLAALKGLTTLGVVSRRRQAALVDRYMRQLGIKATSADQRMSELSGGNQQKVLLARWLCMEPRLLILDEPTRGIDIGAKGEIQRLVNEMAAAGMGILLISSELEELVEGCARVVVLRNGQSVAELGGEALSEEAIVHAMAESGQ